MHTLNIRVTHHRADIPTLEAVTFRDVRKALLDLQSLSSVKECVIIQTCNRVEIFAGAEDVDMAYHDIMDYIMSETITKMKKHIKDALPPEKIVGHMIKSSKMIHDVIEVEYHGAALHHLLRLSSGLESMIVGEDQILGQVKESYELAKAVNTAGSFFQPVFTKTINVGKRARTETQINEGAVSIGSAAVELAKDALGSLEGKTVLLIGAGDMGTLVAKSLAGYNLKSLLVANRTYERGLKLAQELNGNAIKFEDVVDGIKESDLVITAAGAPKALITKDLVEKALKNRTKNGLMIVDVAIPRDVEAGVGKLKDVKLFNIDSLREIAEKNRRTREIESVKVEEIIEEELSLLEKQLYHVDVEEVIKAVFSKAEHIRRKELERAVKILGNGADPKDKKVLDDLTKVIINRTMSPIVNNIRKAAETGDNDTIKVAENWFLKELRHKKG
ncbi:MAG: glutamyl-tRNA reductase [Candidatus Hydrothermarchaeales archaeon]